jgi:putative hydrolase of the HAD superfamily
MKLRRFIKRMISEIGAALCDAGYLQPRAIVFDLDGTLFDRDASFRELVEQQYCFFGAALVHIPHATYVHRVIELDAHGYVDKAVVYRDLAREFGLPDALVQRLLDHFWATYSGLCRVFPDVPAALATLRADGLKLGIITNGSVRMQESKIHHLGFAELFDPILISEREGLRKPDRRIFERALKKLGVTADQAWYVGDHPVVDVRGAYDAGLTPVWRYTACWPRPDVPSHEIRGLDELVRLLDVITSST